MSKPPKPTDAELVAAYFDQLSHPLAEVVQALRELVLAADAGVAEQVKWNSPSFWFTGTLPPFAPKEYKRDIVVFNLHKPDQVLLVFPTGARVPDPSGLLTGNFPDGRKVARFTSLQQVRERAADLQAVVRAWVASVDA